MLYRVPYRALGDAAQTVQRTSAVGAPIVTAALASHAAATAAATGTAATILGMTPALAIPVVGAAIVGITIAVVALLHRACGQTCVITSQWANDAEKLLRQNIEAYFSQPAPRSKSQQAVALANYDSVVNYLFSQCSDPALGDAGKNCIKDRQAGACHWKQTADAVPPWGTPAAGECWNWDAGYRAPIANDPAVVDDAVAISSQVKASIETAPVLLIAGGLILLGVTL